MADVQSNNASSQAKATSSSAKVEKPDECFVCEKQLGASDHVQRLPCNHKSCINCMSHQEAQKLHAKEPISCSNCKQHVSTLEMSVRSRTLLENDLTAQKLFAYALIVLCILWYLNHSKSWILLSTHCLLISKLPASVWRRLSNCFREFMESASHFTFTVRMKIEDCVRKMEEYKSQFLAITSPGGLTIAEFLQKAFVEFMYAYIFTVSTFSMFFYSSKENDDMKLIRMDLFYCLKIYQTIRFTIMIVNCVKINFCPGYFARSEAKQLKKKNFFEFVDSLWSACYGIFAVILLFEIMLTFTQKYFVRT